MSSEEQFDEDSLEFSQEQLPATTLAWLAWEDLTPPFSLEQLALNLSEQAQRTLQAETVHELFAEAQFLLQSEASLQQAVFVLKALQINTEARGLKTSKYGLCDEMLLTLLGGFLSRNFGRPARGLALLFIFRQFVENCGKRMPEAQRVLALAKQIGHEDIDARAAVEAILNGREVVSPSLLEAVEGLGSSYEGDGGRREGKQIRVKRLTPRMLARGIKKRKGIVGSKGYESRVKDSRAVRRVGRKQRYQK